MALSAEISKVYVAPGNAGTGRIEKVENIALTVADIDGLVAFAKQNAVNLVVVGPEAPLVAGLADALRGAGIAVFGPNKEAAQLEASKAFAADFMRRHNIPQPGSQVAHSLEEALRVIQGKSADSYVLKADGLAGGKGVVLPKTAEEARTTLAAMFGGEQFDGAGKDSVVIQERLHGPEVSAFVVTDGKTQLLLPFSQDHKRLRDNDQGPNTGGVGAYSPLPATIVSPEQATKIRRLAEQSVSGLASENIPYQGVLFIGLMLAEERGGDPVVIEYNVRFGDPETEVVLPAVSEAGGDVAGLLMATARGGLDGFQLPATADLCVLTVCLAASGYPEKPRLGDPVYGLDATYPHTIIHQAGTRQDSNQVVTAGGRVLYVTGFGATIDEAAQHAYAAIGDQGIHFAGMHYRHDIGYQGRTALQK
jgi:phosphoribosylamine--glycine ligase